MHRFGRWEQACVFLSLPGSEVRAWGEDRAVRSECRVWGGEAASQHQLSCVSAGPSGASSWGAGRPAAFSARAQVPFSSNCRALPC